MLRDARTVWVGLPSSVALWLMMTAALSCDLLILEDSYQLQPGHTPVSVTLALREKMNKEQHVGF